MSDRATAKHIPLQAPSPAHTGTDIAVRPKVLRRPAHFSAQPAVASPAPTLVPVLPDHTATNTAAPARSWQDDGRFAITLLAIVILVNIVVSAWLVSIEPKPTSTLLRAAPVVSEETPLVTAPSGSERISPAAADSAPVISEQ